MAEKEKTTARAEIKIGGMSCAMCVKAVEKSLRQVPGIEELTVNLASEQAYVEYDEKKAGLADMKQAIEAAGYRFLGLAAEAAEREKQALAEELRNRRRRIAVGFASGMPLMLAMLLMKHPPFAWRLAMLVFSLPGIVFLGVPIFRRRRPCR